MINNGRNNYKGNLILDIMVDEDGEASVVRLIYFLARERNMGCWAIAKHLNDNGYKTHLCSGLCIDEEIPRNNDKKD